MTEPVPSRDSRKAILAFEATEGGAGVLSRLVAEPKCLAEVAKAALILMHYEGVDAAIASGSAAKLVGDAGRPWRADETISRSMANGCTFSGPSMNEDELSNGI